MDQTQKGHGDVARGVEEENPRGWVSRPPQSQEEHHLLMLTRAETMLRLGHSAHKAVEECTCVDVRVCEKEGLLVLCPPCQSGSDHVLLDLM